MNLFYAILFAVLIVCGCVVIYALYSKGDVRVHVSRGKTCFELDAKERSSKG